MSSFLMKIKDKIALVIDKIKKNKPLRVVLICILALLIVVISFGVKPSDNKGDNSVSAVDEYVSNLECRLTNILSKVDGAGEVSVVITVESGMQTVLAMKTTVTESANGKEIVETPVIVNGKTVVLKELYPQVVGVLIVAEGANNFAVLSKLQQATISLLDININQIEILSM